MSTKTMEREATKNLTVGHCLIVEGIAQIVSSVSGEPVGKAILIHTKGAGLRPTINDLKEYLKEHHSSGSLVIVKVAHQIFADSEGVKRGDYFTWKPDTGDLWHASKLRQHNGPPFIPLTFLPMGQS